MLLRGACGTRVAPTWLGEVLWRLLLLRSGGCVYVSTPLVLLGKGPPGLSLNRNALV